MPLHRLAKSFQKLRVDEDFADCSVIVGTQTFRCHKVGDDTSWVTKMFLYI